jgi:alpha-L-rhamnosidase
MRLTIITTILLFQLTSCALQSGNLSPVNLRCEYKVDPVIDMSNPRLSWVLKSDENGEKQTAYQIMVASSLKKLDEGMADLWDSGKNNSDNTYQIEFGGKPLASKMVCYWKVRSWDKNGLPGSWSEPAKWEMGLLEKSDWKAEWIGLDLNKLGKGKVYHLPPAPFLRKEIELKGKVKTAKLYVTALGVYEFSVNGKKIGNDYLAPGWTDYNKRVYYQTYDVTKNLNEGTNAIGSVLSYGWYAGYVGYALLVKNPQVKGFYGDVPALLAQIEVEYDNGEKEVFKTDKSWKANYGPLVESDLLNGETYDARKEFAGWNKTGFNDTGWKPVEVFSKAERAIEISPANPVQITEVLNAISVKETDGGKYIFDMGQNFAGIIKLKVKGDAGDKIVIRYGEMLHQDGTLMTENLRMARATDTYILKGDPNGEEWTPQFTFHGFQFVEVSGLKEKPESDMITGLALGTVTPVAGTFECSNPLVNQLYSNIVWTQRANFIDVPTDCPQRDERLGWTGDAQVYISSATLNMDVAAFFNKWITDLNDSQLPNGAYPAFAPFPRIRATDGWSPGWMEAGVICPYQIYKSYADTRIVEQSWEHMSRFMEFMEKRSKGKYLFPECSFEDITPKGGYGDWLSVGALTSPDMLATMYYAYSATLMSEMAEAIGETDDANHYSEIAGKVKEAFLNHYVDSEGRLKCNAKAYGRGAGYSGGGSKNGFSGHTQTAYANAIYMDMLPGDLKVKAGRYLNQLIEENNGLLSTGFLGVKPLLPALTETGYNKTAYSLLLKKENPSWLFEVVNGATSIWERWNSYTKKEGFVAGMNSFSHYSFGSVNEWMFGIMAGIQSDGPAYKKIKIKPEIVQGDLDFVKASLITMNGKIVSGWKLEGDNLSMEVKIPVNTTAKIFIPASNKESVQINGVAVDEVENIEIIDYVDGKLIVSVGSGYFSIESIAGASL